jgi:hypothetical protein
MNLALVSKFRAVYTSQYRGSHERMYLDSITLSTLRPVSSTLRFPPIHSPEGCNPQCEVWIIMTTWFPQWDLDYVNTTRRGTDKADVTCSWLTQGLRSGRRLIGYGVKTSLLIVCEFNDLGINVYWRNNKGCHFLGKPLYSSVAWCTLSVEVNVLIWKQLFPQNYKVNAVREALLKCCLIRIN